MEKKAIEALQNQGITVLEFSTMDRKDRNKELFDRTWDRLQKLVKTHSLQVQEAAGMQYSTFGNGFHLWTGKCWVTARGSIRWKKISEDEEVPYYSGNITFDRNRNKTQKHGTQN